MFYVFGISKSKMAVFSLQIKLVKLGHVVQQLLPSAERNELLMRSVKSAFVTFDKSNKTVSSFHSQKITAISGKTQEVKEIERTVSAMIGKGSTNHNSRQFCAENVDVTRSPLNICYCNEKIKDVYHKLFDDALERYNAKQKRSDRRISDYYEKIRSGKQEKPFHEIIMQVGNREDMPSNSENGKLAMQILDEYYRGFVERNKSLYVFSAHLHMDEATPHIHIDFVPFITGSTRGLDTRVSLKQALSELGFVSESKQNTEWNQFIDAEKKHLATVMARYGIQRLDKGEHREHLSVLDYKKQERSREVTELTEQAQALELSKAELYTFGV